MAITLGPWLLVLVIAIGLLLQVYGLWPESSPRTRTVIVFCDENDAGRIHCRIEPLEVRTDAR